MKSSIAVTVVSVLLLAAGTPWAQDSKAPGAGAVAPAQPIPSTTPGGDTAAMDAHIKQMQVLHDRMLAAKTPEERQAVMDEQRRAMQAGMGTMHQMRGGGMMGGMGGGMMGQKGRPADMPTQMQMMQKRMDMMQMMMQTMMDQQGMTGAPKAGK
jgi:acetylornithine/succinyldiaminopimelate/putrescine aminotransferase